MTRQALMITCAASAAIFAASAARAATDQAASASAAASTSAAAEPSTTVSDIVVTAERRSEALQSTPVQVSAFTSAALEARRLDGGENLLLAIPNLNYSRTFFGGFSLEIRGVGSQAVGGGGEPGVGVNENFVSLQNNHFADTEFYDTARVEVERGPQGTLYGRSATAGAVNVITNQPTDTLEGSLTGEYGNYDEKKFNGFLNIPINDMFQVRLAGFYHGRGGVGTNTDTGQSVDGRNLYSTRVTIAFKPTERFHAYAMWEHYSEDDDRNTVGKQLCTPDPGPSHIGPVGLTSTEQGFLSTGCADATLYSPNAYGVTNTSGDLAGIYAQELGLLNGNANIGHPPQDPNLHNITSPTNPHNTAGEDFVNFDMTWDATDTLKVESITGYNANWYFYQRDYNRYIAQQPFNTTPSPGCLACLAIGAQYGPLYSLLFPGGVVNDPQMGPSNRLRIGDQGDGHSSEWTEEVRVTSSFSGPVNFSAGALYYSDDSFAQYYVFFNPLTAVAQLADTLHPGALFIDPSYPPHETGSMVGHNYYLVSDDSRTQSYAAFGELYYNITPDLKLTLGVRETDDRKSYDPAFPVLATPGGGLRLQPTQYGNTLATTGRAILAWTPHLAFTDHTMLYASFSRGYKAPGFNPPCNTQCGYPSTSQPEYDNAIEVGTKNTLLGGRLMLNLAGFYDVYQGYQISNIVAKTSINQNINADIYGLEFESIWSPIDRLTLNANIGWLHTRVTGGNVIDQENLTQGNPNLVVIKSADGSNCVVNAAGLAAYVNGINTAMVPPGVPGAFVPGVQEAALLGSAALQPGGSNGVCGGQYGTAAGGFKNFNPASDPLGLYAYSAGQHVVLFNGVGQGVAANIAGNRLPNAPDWTVSLGAQYRWNLTEDWTATLRGDFYWQDFSYARVFNDPIDYLKSWDNVNATLTFADHPLGIQVQLYVKNAFDAQPITTVAVSDASAGLLANTFTLDPRTFGVAVTKKF